MSLRRKVNIFISVEENIERLYYNRGDCKLFDDAVAPSVVSLFGIFRMSLFLYKSAAFRDSCVLVS